MQELVQSGRIFDLIAAVILVVVTIVYARRGFLAGLLGLVGNLVCVGGAGYISKIGAQPLFDLMFSGRLTESITRAIAEGETGISQVLQRYMGFLPEAVQTTLLKQVTALLDTGSPQLAQKIVNEVVQPLVAPMLSVLIFLVCYVVLRLVVQMIVNLLQVANYIPVVKDANKLLGVALGAAAGLVDVFLFLCLLWGILVITNNELSWLNQANLAGSYCFGLFARLNPFM